MTLRAKTRSRKGRDLKRLDGANRRVTRRRRLQRGGATTVDSYTAWLKAVKEENNIYKDPKDPESEDYGISLIKADSEKHQIPVFNGENMDAFAMPNGADLRSTAANVAAMLKLIMEANPTIGQFQNEMRVQQQPSADALVSTDIQAQLQILAEIEHALRNSGNDVNTSLTKQIRADTDILTDASKYPLYIWALYYSAPEGENSVPILASPEQVASEIGSSEASKLSEQAGITP